MAQLPESAQETTTAALLARYVHAAGVRHVFGYPGESVIDFMEAARHRGIGVVSAVREGTAAFMAEAAPAPAPDRRSPRRPRPVRGPVLTRMPALVLLNPPSPRH
jgi:hypothetical protein